MRLAFAKMHSLGNDFVVMENLRQTLPPDLPALAQKLAARRRGIGCDQMLVLGAGAGAECFSYRIFNADGGEVGQCGNGARCALLFLRRRGLTDAAAVDLQTQTTRLRASLREGGEVRVSLPPPVFEDAVEADGYIFERVNLGNPHAVCLTRTADDETLRRLAATLNANIAGGINVGIGAATEAGITLRVHERGSGLTDACGSGALAAALIAMRAGLSPNPAAVTMPGGVLLCGADDDGAPWMQGGAAHVFDGVCDWRDGELRAPAA